MIRQAFLLFAAVFVVSSVSFSQSKNPLWLRYPSISPDGKTVAFCYKGDIYKVDSKGGVATPVTMNEAYDYMPVWSPDGKSIAFASDRNGNFDVYIVDLEKGDSKRLTYNSSGDFPQSFTPDGKNVLFSATRMDFYKYTQFPYGGLPELYSVPVTGGKEIQYLSVAAEDANWNSAGTKLLFHDRKGYEDPWRKHHTSSVARDIWVYTKEGGKFNKLTNFEGEDRNAVWASDNKSVFYLSEKSGSFNIWKMDTENPKSPSQLTKYDKNPVRFLSKSTSEDLCFGYDGEIYIMRNGKSPEKLNISIQTEERATNKTENFTDGATEVAASPSGKEYAFVVRGEIYVTSSEGITKRITTTSGQERNVSFSPDGKTILYAAERNKIWGIYRTSIIRKEETLFSYSTLLKEEPLIVGKTECFLPKYSPDGKEIAYLEDRTAVKIYNIETQKSRMILPANRNYSYSDGDQDFSWSHDSKFLIVNFLQEGNWRSELGLIDASGTKPLLDLTQSGFGASGGKFAMNGKMMLFFSSRNGMKNVASHGNQSDAYGLFFTKSALDRFKMKKEEYQLLKDAEEKERLKDTVAAAKKKIEPLKIEEEGLYDRKVRLTIHSSDLTDALITSDGEKLYYFCRFEDGIDLWIHRFRDNETKLFLKLNAKSLESVQFDKDANNIICIADGKILKIDLTKADKKEVSFNAEMNVDGYEVRSELFEHMWRQAEKKFYVTDLQKTDWNYYKTTYSKFLPYINNNRDFAELMSEMLGELNASHTGCRYNSRFKNPDETANLGAYFDETYEGFGLKITEILVNGPLTKTGTQITEGTIIEKIDGTDISAGMNYYPLLNRKAGKNVLLSLYNPSSKKRWEEIVVPINPGQVQPLLYKRWVKRMQQYTDSISGGKIGYMHVQGMDDGSYREFYDQVMGKYVNRQALIVDTRFNGGGWLHDDLATFLSGKQYINFVPRGQKIGVEPADKWIRSSAVLMGEGNYSDAHMFPVVYKTLGIGKLIGMPVPGTGTAVWWETQMDPTLIFGIPQVGVMTMDGKYYENTQLEPDVKIANDYDKMLQGIDQQLETAVKELMK